MNIREIEPMKKKYEKPVAELIRFSFKDMVVASGGNMCTNKQGNGRCPNPHNGKYK